jgi:hypothetical protein
MERSTSPLQPDNADGNGTVFLVLKKNGLPEAVSGLADAAAAPVTRADLEAAMQAAPDNAPDLSDPAVQRELCEKILAAYLSGRAAQDSGGGQ